MTKIVFIDKRFQITLLQHREAIYHFLNKSVVTVMHELNFIYSKTHLETIAYEKTRLSFGTFLSFFSLAESPPPDLQIMLIIIIAFL